MSIYPFILAGGLGTRLAPLSTPEKPKPFLSLISENTLLQDTLLRLNNGGYHPASVICNVKHKDLALENLTSAEMEYENIILEAEGRGTAFSIAIAVLLAHEKDQNALILILPCDHYIQSPNIFHKTILKAQEIAKGQYLTLMGVRPTKPDTGYGYIETDRNDALSFKEKPDKATAQQYCEQGHYLWNSGIFLFPAKTILESIKSHAPEILQAADASLRASIHEDRLITLPAGAIRNCPNISIDYAVLEKEKHLKVVTLDTKWSDLGTLEALRACNII